MRPRVGRIVAHGCRALTGCPGPDRSGVFAGLLGDAHLPWDQVAGFVGAVALVSSVFAVDHATWRGRVPFAIEG